MDSQLKQMSDDLKEIIEHINESNKDEEVSNQVSKYRLIWTRIFSYLNLQNSKELLQLLYLRFMCIFMLIVNKNDIQKIATEKFC